MIRRASVLSLIALASMPVVAEAAPADDDALPYPNSLCALGATNAHDAIENDTIKKWKLEPLPGASEYGTVGPNSIEGCTGAPGS